MKKIFLINFATPMMREMALRLAERGVEILYWEAYRFDKEIFACDKAQFPNTVFHHFHDAKKDILPPGIDQSKFPSVSKELIERMRPYEFHAIAAMEKDDFAGDSFPKRRLRYYTLIKEQYGLLSALKPEVLLWSLVPNSARAHVLYGLAKVLGIDQLMLFPVNEPPRSLLLRDYTEPHVGFLEEVARQGGKNAGLEDLSFDVRDDYLKQRNPKTDATPNYMKTTMALRGPLAMAPGAQTIWKHLRDGTFLRAAADYFSFITSTQHVRGPGEGVPWITLQRRLRQWRKISLSSKSEYESLERYPDFSRPYIYVALHYQPEASTNPMGNVFEEQMFLVDMIASAVPEDWRVYVKEHPAQWIPSNILGFRYRPEGYYRRMASLRNVELVPVNVTTFEMIKNCKATATITGAAGWESITRDKPVLLFGYAYYMGCEGVFRITDQEACRSAIERIEDGYKIDQQKVINWLSVFDKTAIKAAYYRSKKFIENPYLTREEVVKNLVEAYWRGMNHEA